MHGGGALAQHIARLDRRHKLARPVGDRLEKQIGLARLELGQEALVLEHLPAVGGRSFAVHGPAVDLGPVAEGDQIEADPVGVEHLRDHRADRGLDRCHAALALLGLLRHVAPLAALGSTLDGHHSTFAFLARATPPATAPATPRPISTRGAHVASTLGGSFHWAGIVEVPTILTG